jgi:hypothetical protein
LLKHTVLALPKSELALQGDLAAYTIYKFEKKKPKKGPREPKSGPFLRILERKWDNRGLGEGVFF